MKKGWSHFEEKKNIVKNQEKATLGFRWAMLNYYYLIIFTLSILPGHTLIFSYFFL